MAKPTDVSSVQLCQADFECALNEITPAFGVQLDELAGKTAVSIFLFHNTIHNPSACIGSGIIEYCPEFRKLMSSLSTFAQQVSVWKQRSRNAVASIVSLFFTARATVAFVATFDLLLLFD